MTQGFTRYVIAEIGTRPIEIIVFRNPVSYELFLSHCSDRGYHCRTVDKATLIALLEATGGIGVNCYLDTPHDIPRRSQRRLQAKARAIALGHYVGFACIDEPIAFPFLETFQEKVTSYMG